MHVDAQGLVVAVDGCPGGGFATLLGLWTPANMGAMTSSRRVNSAAMVRAAASGTC